MRVIAKRTLRAFWESDPRAEQPLKAWHAVAKKAEWSSPADVKVAYGNASIVGNDRVVFNIGGNRYRLIIRFDYSCGIAFVRFVGTHAEYDEVDATEV
ncbi:type II toxin-antitoxin system HigB family toxin [Candidatus Palauibacter sp.]|uniref:type II toxin-antitoxin system HigB family toxin n=1 Tax=Candidatus Palauibacter sp. TaxID=3101350 RepID=UPI003B59A39F